MELWDRPQRPPFGPGGKPPGPGGKSPGPGGKPPGPGGKPPGSGGKPPGPGGKPPGPGGTPPGSGGPPAGAPPKFTPSEAQGTSYKGASPSGPSLKAVDPGAVFPCMYRYTYIWPNRGEGFWAYITYIGPTSLAGWRYGYWGWEYFGMDLKRIRSFYCY
ncbi:MAG: hypothetical protein ACRCW2_00900 [Cellulosilyticaceae bacterium]